MTRLILIVALVCTWTSVVLANPVGEQVSTGVNSGFCNTDKFKDTYLGTALGIPITAFLLLSTVSFLTGAHNYDELFTMPAFLAASFSGLVQACMSIAYKATC
jgi:hypothetical protein